jgi:hypothetical protein
VDIWNQGWVGILVGAALSLYFYLKSKRRASVRYRQHGFNLVGRPRSGRLMEHITVRFKDQPVSHVTVTVVTIWNAGNDMVSGTAIAKLDPIRLSPACGQILDCEVVRETRSACGVTASFDQATPEAVDVGFDFLEPGDGAVVRITHSCLSPWCLISGSLKGADFGRARLPREVHVLKFNAVVWWRLAFGVSAVGYGILAFVPDAFMLALADSIREALARPPRTVPFVGYSPALRGLFGFMAVAAAAFYFAGRVLGVDLKGPPPALSLEPAPRKPQAAGAKVAPEAAD